MLVIFAANLSILRLSDLNQDFPLPLLGQMKQILLHCHKHRWPWRYETLECRQRNQTTPKKGDKTPKHDQVPTQPIASCDLVFQEISESEHLT